jgi:fused signal recognition particle receptor
MAAADTYRAAAAEQLETWAERAGAELVRGQEGSDPGAVAYDAINAARTRGADVVIVDTAGRLHTQSNLMEELAKVRRVIQKQIPDAPHETLTKLDGTARGGIALAIASDLGIPVKLIGVGETLEDLRPFDPGDYAKALLAE